MPDKHPIVHTFMESMMILFFEMFGTFLLASLYMLNKGPLALFLGYFILLVLSARISGSHYNPIVTLAFMLRKDAGQFNKWLGVLYMAAQFLGAICGCLVAFFVFRNVAGAHVVISVLANRDGADLIL